MEKRMVKIIENNGIPLRSLKPRPNDKCHCGSGKKLKHCCRTETQYRFDKQVFEKKEVEKHKDEKPQLLEEVKQEREALENA